MLILIYLNGPLILHRTLILEIHTVQRDRGYRLKPPHKHPLFTMQEKFLIVFYFQLQHGADVHAKDKGGLVPLHNACSYGHFEVTELLIRHGANVGAMDLWQFSPLHEAASKGQSEFPCKKTNHSRLVLDFNLNLNIL